MLNNLHSLQLVVGLSESEIGQVHVGQVATVAVEALNGRKVAAHVVKVGQVPSSSSGAVSYDVTFQLDQNLSGVKVGMSATAEVVVKQAEGLNVPTSAIKGGSVTVVRKRQTRHPGGHDRARRRQHDDHPQRPERGRRGRPDGHDRQPLIFVLPLRLWRQLSARRAERRPRRQRLPGRGRRIPGGRSSGLMPLRRPQRGRRVRQPRERPLVQRRPPLGAAGGQPPPAIVVAGVSKTYILGTIRVPALREVSMRIERGDFVAIMGSSGSGKSTLMNILGCLDLPTGGGYEIDGVDVRDMDEDDLADLRNRKIGFVFQSFNLVARTSALANVELPLAYAGLDRHERRLRAERALTAVGMAKRMLHQPSELSGGQQQRVAVARALVTNPALILADEPTGNLDSRSTEDVLRIFSRLNDEGRTVVLITHEPDVAEQAKRVIHLADGRIVEDRRLVELDAASPEVHAQKSAHQLYGGVHR